MTDAADRYRSVWEDYWGHLTGAPGEIFWDASPATGAAVDLLRFNALADPTLPLLDIGCGNGTQTRFLGEHFARVIGTDVSEKALAAARSAAAGPNIEYRALDVLAPDHVEALHAEIGDANVYVRAVLHQLLVLDRPPAARSIERLLGRRGIAYIIELSPAAEAYFGALIQKYGAPPPGLARVLSHGITPASFGEGDMAALFPEDRFEVLASGDGVIRTTHRLPEGDFAEVPAFYRVVRRR